MRWFNQTNAAIRSRVGPKPMSRFCQRGRPSSSGRALMTTPFSSSSVSSPGLAKAGSSVLKRSALRLFGPSLGYANSFLNVPWIAAPWLVTSATLSACTCCLKSVYGMSTYVCSGANARMSAQFAARTTRKVSHQGCGRRQRGPSGLFAGVAPLGALVTEPILAQRGSCRKPRRRRQIVRRDPAKGLIEGLPHPRQIDGEDASLPRPVAHANRATGLLDALAADREPEAEPGSIAATLLEHAKQIRDLSGR